MSAESNTPDPKSGFPTLPELRCQILSSLAQALAAASNRLLQSASGQSVFSNDADLKSTLALLHLVPHLLPLLKDADDDDDDAPYNHNRLGQRDELAHPSLGPMGNKILEELEEMRRQRTFDESPQSPESSY